MATFSIILDSCLVCDGRRVEPNDLIDIYLDETKFPDAENPVRAVVLDVRLPEPPESVLGAVALDVQASDADMPVGVETLDPDDIQYVQCVGCCIRNTERIEALEEAIVGTLETLTSPLPPFLPNQFNITQFGVNYQTLIYQGEMDGFPYWENVGATYRLRRQDDNWILTQPGDTYTQQVEGLYVPWLAPEDTLWTHSGPPVIFGYNTFIFNDPGGYAISEIPILPSQFNAYYDDNDLVFARDPDNNVYYWTGENWKFIDEIIPWDPNSAVPAGPVGPFYRITSSGSVDGVQAWPGDIYWKTPVGQLPRMLKFGVAGTFANVGVTTNTAQTITANKNFTGTTTLATVDINGGAIDGTTIGATTPSDARFLDVTSDGTFTVKGELRVGASLSDPAPVTGAIYLFDATTDFYNNISTAALTASRFATLPDRTGTVVLGASPTGYASISEVLGFSTGQATLVAGTVAVAVTGVTAASPAVVTPLTAGAGLLRASCAAGILTITSSDGADTRTISYMVKV